MPWTLVVGPPLEPATVALDHAVHIPIPPGPNPEIVFPSTPSTMVSVGNAGHGREHREIWDLRTNRRIGTTRGLRTLSENLGGFFRPISALSPDGRIFVTQGLGPFDLVAWDVAAEKQIVVLHPEHAPTAGLTFATFAGPQRLLACGLATPFQILGIGAPSRKKAQRFPRENQYDRGSLAVSPDGRYFSVFDQSQQLLRFYDTESGAPVGQLPLPRFQPAGPMGCECVAFAPDGTEVAALFFYNDHSHLAAWDLRGARLVKQLDFGGNLRAILRLRSGYLYPPLEWFPNGARWLVYGHGIVDRNAGKLVWNVADEPNRVHWMMRHVASDKSLLSVVEENEGFALASLGLPLADINRAAEGLPVGREK